MLWPSVWRFLHQRIQQYHQKTFQGKRYSEGRIGGDEFAAFIPVPDIGWARKKAGELAEALNTVIENQDRSWQMSVSIGVAVYPEAGTLFEELYGNADKALYETKIRGRNGFHIPALRERQETELENE